MGLEIREVTSDEDREKVFRLRYDVYITEMDRGTQGVDHKNRLLYDELDENCVMVGAFENGRAVGTVRVNHAWKTDIGENGGDKLVHGSGGIFPAAGGIKPCHL